MEKKVRRWTTWANDCQCKHNDKLKELEDKRTKSCKLQDIIKKAIPDVIADCNDLLETFPMSLATYNNEVYPDIKAGTIVAKCLIFMNEASNINQRREFEKDTAEKRAKRVRELEDTKDTKTGDEFNELVALIAGKEPIYFPNGLYERYIEVCDTPEYKLLRKIEESNVGNKDITLYYQAVCLYVALENERQEIEDEIQWREGTPKEGGGLPCEGKTLIQQFYEALKKEEQKDRAKKCFAQAIKDGVMVETTIGYKWLYWVDENGCPKRGNNARLGYFLHEVLNHRRNSRIPYDILNKLFGVKRLDTVIDKAINTKHGNPQEWRADIYLLIERALS